MKSALARKTFVLLPFLFLVSTVLFAQAKFEKGYFVSKAGQKTECLIWNLDPRINPASFTYKLAEGDKTNTLLPEDAGEVGIEGTGKYISAMVKIDRSKDYTTDFEQLSSTRAPEWSTENLFLKVVVDGQAASLYSYYERGLVRFFYRQGNSTLEQLVHKPYLIDQSNLNENNDYLNQLNVSVNCNPGQPSWHPGYKENDLRRYFTQFNTCKGTPVANTTVAKKTKRFSVSLLAGMEYATLRAQYFPIRSITRFDGKMIPFGGAELEYTMPFNKNKFSFLLDIRNENYSSTGSDSLGTARIEYAAIESSIGPRYRIFVNDDLHFFVDALMILEFRTSSSYQWTQTKPNNISNGYSVDINTPEPVWAIGAGCGYKDVAAELRYFSTRELFQNRPDAGSNFNRFALIIKYRIFKF